MRNTVKIEIDPTARREGRSVIQRLEVNGAEIFGAVEIEEHDHGLGKEVTITFLTQDFEMLLVEKP